MQCKIVSFAYRAYALCTLVYFAYHKNKKKKQSTPLPPMAVAFFNADANILWTVFNVCFWYAARYNKDDNIHIHNALI